MRASEAVAAPEGFPAPPRWLLIGNSRWHWAGPEAGEAESPLRLWLRHSVPLAGGSLSGEGMLATAAAGRDTRVPGGLRAWAAVGAVPSEAALPEQRRLTLADVPLDGMPPWLGIDRALGAWGAWGQLRQPLLVADAGTVLSLTRVDGGGAFAGGRLLAGLALQLRAMARGTTALPCPETGLDTPLWPHATAAAMVRGVRSGLAAAILAAHAEALREDPACRLVLTGGDSETLAPLLDPESTGLQLRPALALEAMAALRPG